MEDQNPKHLTWLPFVIGISAAIGMYGGYKLQLPKSYRESIHKENLISTQKNQQLYDVLSYIESKYVDSVNFEESSDFLIQQLCFAIDPYTTYLKKSELANLEDEIDGLYSGVGLRFKVLNDQAYISYVEPEGPAKNSGLEVGDIIKEVNQNAILSNNTSVDSIIKYIQTSSEKVSFSIERKTELINKKFEITKKEISLKSINATTSLDENTFYIKLDRFSERTYREFMLIVEEYIQKKNKKNLVLDLRDNSGGVLDAAADLLNQMITEPNMVMFTTQDRQHKKKEYKATGKPFFRFGKIFVLINENTASASEVLAGSLQDLGKAKILGSNSFGKGTVLELFPLSDGSSLELASARIFLPSGRCIQKPYDKNPDSTAHWLSPFKADTNFISYGNKELPNGQGLIPDTILNQEIVFNQSEIEMIAEDFVIQNYQEIKLIKDKKNAQSLIETLALKKLINPSNDKLIIKNKNKLLDEIRYKIFLVFVSEEQEILERLKKDSWVNTAIGLSKVDEK